MYNTSIGSNYGETVDISAPAEDIWGTKLGGSYDVSVGTSGAVAEASGVGVLMLQANPSLTPEKIRELLLEGANTITTDKGKVLRINAKRAVEKALDEPQGIEEIVPLALPFISAIQIQHEQVSFAYTVPAATSYILHIFDVTGRGVCNQSGQLTAGSGQITYNPMSMSEGVYFWRVVTECGEGSGKFVFVK